MRTTWPQLFTQAYLSLCLLLAGCDAEQVPTANTAASNADVPAVTREDRRLLSEDYARFRKSQISNPVYHLALGLQANSPEFSGTATLIFDLAANQTAPVTVDFDSGTINSLSLNGEAVPYSFERYFISIPAAAFTAGSNTLTISYSKPYATDGRGLHKFTDPEDGEEYFYTSFEPYNANRLFPHFDQPNLKAPLTLEVTVPAAWQVIANTRESEILTEGERKHWIFPATPPLSSYVYAMYAGPYASWEGNADGIPLRLFARKTMAAFVNPEEWFGPTRQSFAFYQDYFDLAYPFGKYDQVLVPDFNPGAMENVAAVAYHERYLSRGTRSTAQLRTLASTIAHEMSHMWFGDLVTMDWWNGLWLNESFATYLANLELDQASSFTNAWDYYYINNKLAAYSADQLITTHPIELKVPTTADAFTNFDDITYDKGGSVLRQLPFLIGEDNVRKGVSNYLKKYAYGNTTLDDFVAELSAAGNINLDQWQQEWLYTSGVNTIQADFTCADATITSLRLLQSVPATTSADKILRSQRTQVGLYRYTDNEMLLSGSIPVSYKGAVTYVPEAIGQPCPDFVLPNESDWAFMKIKFDAASISTLAEHINDFPNAMTRLMLWQALWDNVEAGDTSLLAYLDFVLANIGNEQDENVVRNANTGLGAAFSFFARFGNHANELARIEEFLLTQLQNAEPGSEIQNIWYDSFVSRAHTTAGLDYLTALLTGESTIAGISIDQDKRWNILIALNRYQHGDYAALLAEESSKDISDQGQLSALVAEAIRPDAAIKQKWLDVMINNPTEYKLAAIRIVMRNLFPDEQVNLTESFATQILAAVPVKNGATTEVYLGEFATYMSAASCTEASNTRLAQANNEFRTFQPAVVKSYRVHQQLDEMCVKVKNSL